METGAFKNIANSAYHGGNGISKSGLDLIGKSPLHYWAAYLDPDRPERVETPAMELGTAIHSAVLEPDKFATDYVVLPADAPRKPTAVQRNAKKPSDDTVAAIMWWDAFNEEHKDRRIIDADDYESIVAIQRNVRNHPAARVLLDGGEAELSMFWEDSETGVLCKCRPDFMNYKQNVIVDVKSTEDASPAAFMRSVVNYGYHVQAAWYLDGVKAATGTAPKAFIFAAFEKSRPHATAFYYADPEMIEIGRKLYRERLAVYAQCLASNLWPGYPETLQAISLPVWALKAANDN